TGTWSWIRTSPSRNGVVLCAQGRTPHGVLLFFCYLTVFRTISTFLAPTMVGFLAYSPSISPGWAGPALPSLSSRAMTATTPLSSEPCSITSALVTSKGWGNVGWPIRTAARGRGGPLGLLTITKSTSVGATWEASAGSIVTTPAIELAASLPPWRTPCQAAMPASRMIPRKSNGMRCFLVTTPPVTLRQDYNRGLAREQRIYLRPAVGV